jgi:hypothetical protein
MRTLMKTAPSTNPNRRSFDSSLIILYSYYFYYFEPSN